MFQTQKDRFVPDVTQTEEIQNSASIKLYKWSKNMVNVENWQFLKENWAKPHIFVPCPFRNYYPILFQLGT